MKIVCKALLSLFILSNLIGAVSFAEDSSSAVREQVLREDITAYLAEKNLQNALGPNWSDFPVEDLIEHIKIGLNKEEEAEFVEFLLVGQEGLGGGPREAGYYEDLIRGVFHPELRSPEILYRGRIQIADEDMGGKVVR